LSDNVMFYSAGIVQLEKLLICEQAVSMHGDS